MKSDLATSEELGCPKCKKFGCDCDGKRNLLPLPGDVCAVCRRNKALCICVSHMPYQVMLDEADERRVPPPQDEVQTLEGKVNEAMNYYYSRDAEGLARFIRRQLA